MYAAYLLFLGPAEGIFHPGDTMTEVGSVKNLFMEVVREMETDSQQRIYAKSIAQHEVRIETRPHC